MLINPQEIEKSLSSYKWKYENKYICKNFVFDTYMDGVDFLNEIIKIAEKQNHHPDIVLGYCTLKISISSHDMGGVTTKCINLAMAIENINNI